ncbi:hypothetical protein A4X13_0g2804 [Tilletia indica]|uniref:Uncharacterized protein n=1 Tax=Tilletia indica TaxID=43049 RepID=A0A177TQN1_9BASI|nr:hypothetical protein A4X13_0g2804 [Tilletia indica]
MTQNPLLLLVILPHGLRQYITWALDFDNLTRMRDTGDIRDPDGGKWEVCVWSVSGDKIWQPPIGLGAAIHQLLVTAAMLTAWTVWKVSSGAPWRKMHYGRTLNNALICGYNACDTRTGDFDDWIRM